MDVIDMGPLHPELLIKEEKICVISDVMGETEFFGRNEWPELVPTAEGTVKVEPEEEIQDVKDEVKSEITVDDQAVDHQDMFGPSCQNLLMEEAATAEACEVPSASHCVSPGLQNAQGCGSCFYSECAACFSVKSECSDCVLCVNSAKESSCDAPLEQFKPKVDTFISDFTPPTPSCQNKHLEMDPSRLESSAFDTKRSDKSEKVTDVGGPQHSESRVETDAVNDSKGASGSESPTVQDTVGHPDCNSVNDAAGKTNGSGRHVQETVNGDRIEKFSEGSLLERELERYATRSSSRKVPEHGIVCHKSRNSKHENNIETMGSTVKLSKRLSSNYKLRKCLCDCSTSRSVEGKPNVHKPHRTRWRAGTGGHNNVIIGNAMEESKGLISDFKLEQRLNENNSAIFARDKMDVATAGDSHEAVQKKGACVAKNNNHSIQKEMQHSRAAIDDTPYHCDRCKKQYATSRGLRDHYVFHTGARPFVCKVCSKMFPTLTQLVKHSHTHKRGQVYACQLCDKEFRFLLSLKRHVLLHTGERPYECILCDRRFFTLPHLKNHIHIHTGERPFVCRLCWKGFSSRAGLRKHRFHHARGQPYSCRSCSSQFRRYRLFVQHVRTHRISKYECGECRQVFTSLPLMRKHARTHSPIRPYTCTLCSSGFSNSTSLILHYRSHRRSEHPWLTFPQSEDGTETLLTC